MGIVVNGRTKLTYDDYVQFPDDGRIHELIDGDHYVAPPPDLRHQRAGVPRYWIVDPAKNEVRTYDLVDGVYQESGVHRERVELTVGRLRAIVDLKAVW